MEPFSKDLLKEVMKKRGIKTPVLAQQTGIPVDRIYAWYRDKTNPKKEDQDVLEKWIAGDSSNKNEERNPVLQVDVEIRLSDYLALLKKTADKAEENQKAFQRIIEKSLAGIGASLDINRGILEEVSLNVASAREVGLKSLSRLEELPEGHLFHEAGNNAVLRMKGRKTRNNHPGGGK